MPNLSAVLIFAIVSTADEWLLLLHPGLSLLGITVVLLCLQGSLQAVLARLGTGLGGRRGGMEGERGDREVGGVEGSGW